jgi:hypothetical protein
MLCYEVRGPALASLGFKPTPKGLEAFMASREPADDMSALSDEEFVPIVDAHNRIVMMMQGMSPAHIPDALSMRGEKVVDEFAPEEGAGEEGEEGAGVEGAGEEGEEGAEGAPAAALDGGA